MRTIFEGKHVFVRERDGWEFVERKTATEAVAIVAVTEAGEVVLTEQYRRPVDARVIDWPAGLIGDEPPERDDVRERGGLGREDQPALRDRARHAGVLERAQQPADVRPLPPDDDGQVAPRHRVVDVEPPQLAGDRRVLLRGVWRDPRVDRRRCGRTVPCDQLDSAGRCERLGEPL